MAFKVTGKMVNNNSKMAEQSSVIKAKEDNKIEFIPLDKLQMNPNNKYGLVNIDELAEDIKVNGLNNNLLVRPIENGKYELIGGHRRYTALNKLVADGFTQFRVVQCKVRELDDIDTQINLIMDNALTRELTDSEKLFQIEELEKLGKLKRERGEEIANIRKFIATAMQMSETQVQRYKNVGKNIIPELRDEIDNGNLKFSSANELASLSEESQRKIIDLVKSSELTKSEAEKIRKEFKKFEAEKEEEINRKTGIIEEEFNEKVKLLESEIKNKAKENEVLKKNIDKNIEAARQELEKDYAQKKANIISETELKFENEISNYKDLYINEQEKKKALEEELKKLKSKENSNEDIELYKANMKLESLVANTFGTLVQTVLQFKRMKKEGLEVTEENIRNINSIISKSSDMEEILRDYK